MLVWGLSEISRRDERSAQERRFDREQELQDQRLRDDRDHERALRETDLENRRIDDYREFQRSTLHAMQDAVSGLRKNLIAAAELSMVIPSQPEEKRETLRIERAGYYSAMNDHLERPHTLIPQVDDTRIRNLAEQFAQLSANAQASSHPVAELDDIVNSEKQSRLYDDWRERTKGFLDTLTDVNVDLVKRAIGPTLRRLYAVRPELLSQHDDETSTSADTPAVRPAKPLPRPPL